MNRFVTCAFAGVSSALLAPGAGGAAPVPKDAGKGDATPDLAAVFTVVGRAVKDEKWPAEADEKKLKDTPRVVLQRMLKAAEQKERGLPVDFEKLTRADVVKEHKEVALRGKFVIAETVQGTTATDAVIFASGDVRFTLVTNCVIVARNVRCTGADNCTIIAGEYIRLTGADRRRNRDGSVLSDGAVLVAGQWIRVTGLDGTICHVIRPGNLPAPDEAKWAGTNTQPAIRITTGQDVVFLNDRSDTGATSAKNSTYLPQKAPIAK
jgi:hypothetical protein